MKVCQYVRGSENRDEVSPAESTSHEPYGNFSTGAFRRKAIGIKPDVGVANILHKKSAWKRSMK
jgi:hypothetical protein